MTSSRCRGWPRAVGVLAVTGVLLTAFAVADELPMARQARKNTANTPPGVKGSPAQLDPVGSSRVVPSEMTRGSDMQIGGAGAVASPRLRPMTIEDAGAQAWYNGRKLPILKPTILRDPQVDALNASSRGTAVEGKQAKSLPAVREYSNPVPAAPVSCATGVGCQLPNDNVGVGTGRDLVGFPIDANLEDANGDVLGAASDATAGPGGTHSYVAADNFKTTASGTINKLCWWGFYSPATGSAVAGTGAEDCSGIVPGGAHDLGTATGTFAYVTGTNNSAPTASTACSQYGGVTGGRFDNDVWFRWKAPCTAVVTFETCYSTDLDTKIAVYTATGGGANGCPTGDTTLVNSFGGTGLNGKTCSDDAGCGVDWQSFVQFQATAGTQYILRLGLFPDTSNFPGLAGAFNIRCADDDCSVGADNYTVTFYADDNGGTLPGTQLNQFTTGSNLTLNNKFATGNVVFHSQYGNLAQYQYEATLTGGQPVTADECYWISIRNNVTGACDWFWQSSPDGDGRSNMNIDGGGYLVIASNDSRHDNFDLAYCVNVATDPDGCFPIVPSQVLYNQDNSDFFGAIDYTQQYQIFRPGGSTPHAITYISATGGATGCDQGLTGTEIYALVEFFDTFVAAADGDPVQGDYLGGVLVDLGAYPGGGSNYVSFILTAPPGTYFAATGDDSNLIVALRMGYVVNGVFEAEPARDTIYTDPPCGPAEDSGVRVSFLFAVDGDAGSLDETVGQHISSTYYSDGWGGGDASDRVHLGADGPLIWGGGDEGAPILELRGAALLDCDRDGNEDVLQIACFESGYFGTAGCETDQCAIYDALGTNGLVQSPFFMDPLVQTGIGPANCIPAAEDSDASGVIDDCERADCDEDGIPNNCEVNCAAFDFLHSKTCSQAVLDGDIATCGLATDCNSNALPDECELAGNDCNGNLLPDECDVPPLGTDADCNENLTPDYCEVGNGETDCDNNGTLDICERTFLDCNRNGVTDQCDVLLGESNDANQDGVPDECPDTCYTPFDGFESDPPFTLNTKVDGIDYLMPGNGDEWSTQSGLDTAKIVAPPACPGWGTRALAQNSDTNGIAGSGVFGPSTTSELFNADSQGRVPVSSNRVEVTFDWTLVGPRNSDNDIRMFFYDAAGNTADRVTILWFASDISSVGVPEPGTLHILGGEGDFSSTGIPLIAGECNKAKVIFTNLDQSVEVQIARNGGPFVTVYGPTPGNVLEATGAQRIDFFTINAFNSGALPQNNNDAASMLLIDNIEVCETGAAVDCASIKGPDGQPSVDCNGDQICDAYQISSTSDRNANAELDICEGFCGDCNHNFIPDTYEIAQGTLVDTTPANGVPDVCELATGYNINFENYALGDVEGQGGWRTVQNADGEIRQDTDMGSLTKYLAVKAVAGSELANGIVLGPRIDSVGDGDIEVWSWKMRIKDPPGGSTKDFGRVFVEVLDLCEDAPTLVNNIFGIIGARNVGIQLTTLASSEGAANVRPDGAIAIYLLGTFGGVPQYSQADAVAVPDATPYFYNNTYAAGLRIHNNYGQGTTLAAYIASNQADITLPPGPSAIRIGTADSGESVSQYLNFNGQFRWRGGDRQLMIRTDGNYGATDDIEFLFDDFKYETRLDCDGDTIPDNVFLASNPTHDRNTDGIPDRCQDCDNDCGGFPIAATSRGCLDPCEINANATGCGGLGGGSLDCNANNIPDACDVMTDRPAHGTNRYLAGGGSCDFNGNGVPDECTPGFADCNNNGCHDAFELASAGFGGTATNVNGGPIDECEADCNHNNIPDVRDLQLAVAGGGSQDGDEFGGPFTGDGIPDECCVDGPGGVVIAANGDMDHDGDRDAEDYQLIQRCAGQTPPNCPDSGCVSGVGTVRGSATGGFAWDGLQCGCADFNGDGKVDDCDLQVFQTLITGP